MYIMCVCLFSALSRRVGALQISMIIIITCQRISTKMHNTESRLGPASTLFPGAYVHFSARKNGQAGAVKMLIKSTHTLLNCM